MKFTSFFLRIVRARMTWNDEKSISYMWCRIRIKLSVNLLINVWKLCSVDATLPVVGSSLQSREIVVRIFQRRKERKWWKITKEKDGIHHKSNIAACLYVCVSFSLAHVRRVSLPFFIPAHFIQILRTEGKSSFFKSYSILKYAVFMINIYIKKLIKK